MPHHGTINIVYIDGQMLVEVYTTVGWCKCDNVDLGCDNVAFGWEALRLAGRAELQELADEIRSVNE